jgi:hypothetical protein
MFCKEHQGQYPACSFCGRLIPPQQQEPGMTRGESLRCPTCRATAIETIDQARPIFTRLIQWVNAQGLVYNYLPLSLELVDRPQLAELLKGQTRPDSLGATMITMQTVNGRVTSTKVDKVAVLEGLPSIVFQGVTIHELGHVWLLVHDIKGLPSWAEEGFCEFLSYRYYTQLNTDESRYHAKSIESNPNPIYGDGFRHVRAMADAMGFRRFVEMLRSTKRLPSNGG